MDCSHRHLHIAYSCSRVSISHNQVCGWTVSLSSLDTSSRRTHRTYTSHFLEFNHRPSEPEPGLYLYLCNTGLLPNRAGVEVKVNLSCARHDELCASKYAIRIIFSAGTRFRSAIRFTSRKIYPLERQRTANQTGGSASGRAGLNGFKKREYSCFWRETMEPKFARDQIQPVASEFQRISCQMQHLLLESNVQQAAST